MAGLYYMKVGEVMGVDGVLVECVKDEHPETIYCTSCVFYKTDRCLLLPCIPENRRDYNHVHFRRVES